MKVIDFTKKTIKKEGPTADDILAMASGILKTVIVIGIDADGDMFFSSNIDEKRELIYQLEALKFDVLAGEFDGD